MPSDYDVPDALRNLAALGRRDDLNLRPVLLRVTTDLFVMKDHHAPDEIRQFEEIALHMLDEVDGETRAAVAGKLATYRAAPEKVVERLLALGGEAAAVCLEKSRAVGYQALTSAASFGNMALATAVARRNDLDAALVRALAARSESEVLLALVKNASAPITHATFVSLVRRARGDSLLADALLARSDDADDLAPLFLDASPELRAAIILAARRRALGRPRQMPIRPDGALLAELEKLAFAPDRRPFAAALAAATGATAEDMGKVVGDRSGEPLALVLAALGMTPEAATRIFLTGDPAIAHSYERVAALQQLVADISAQTARRLVVRFVAARHQPVRYVPVTDPTASATPGRSKLVTPFAQVPARGTGLGDPRLRRVFDRTRR